jgi:hypothetical protein
MVDTETVPKCPNRLEQYAASHVLARKHRASKQAMAHCTTIPCDPLSRRRQNSV